MSNFLSKLLDRTAGRAPVLQRRRPSFFEAGPSKVMRDGEIDEETHTEIDRTPAGSRASERSQPRNSGPQFPPASVLTAPPKSASARHDDPSPGSRLIAEKASLESAADAPEPARIHEVAIVRESHVIIAPEIDRVSLAQSLQPSSAPLSAPDIGRRTISESPPSEPWTKPDIDKTAAEPLRNSPRASAQQHGLAPFPKMPSVPASKSTPPPTVVPPIQVSIGRIEVRATQPAPAISRKSAPGGPKLTLENYLASRHGGAK